MSLNTEDLSLEPFFAEIFGAGFLQCATCVEHPDGEIPLIRATNCKKYMPDGDGCVSFKKYVLVKQK